MKIYEDGIERNATPDEVAEIETREAQYLAQQKAQAKAAADKAKAKADVLLKLGLTADEVEALLA
jgi:murein L,D-transpeptidase YcbB/YkuD